MLFDHDEVQGVIRHFVKKCQKMTSKIIDFISKIFHLKATNEGIFSSEGFLKTRENDVKTSFLHDFIMFSNSGHAEIVDFCINDDGGALVVRHRRTRGAEQRVCIRG